MKTIVIGLGNPLLGDDGVGWRIAEALRTQLPVEVDCLAVGGLALMERLIGYERAILVDAMNSGLKPAGSITCFALEDLPGGEGGHLASTHDVSLPVALQVGRALGAALPRQVTVLAVEAQRVYDFSQELTPPVAAAVPLALLRVQGLLQGWACGAGHANDLETQVKQGDEA